MGEVSGRQEDCPWSAVAADSSPVEVHAVAGHRWRSVPGIRSEPVGWRRAWNRM
jgi:hypothetical protein